MKASPHPDLMQLALYAGNDLSFWRAFRVRHHVHSCEDCSAAVTALRDGAAELLRQAKAETLTGFEAIADWSQIESEMVGNISVGLAAARCVDHDHRRRNWVFASLATAGLTAVFCIGWLTHTPADETRQLLGTLSHWSPTTPRSPAGTVMRSLPDGIAVRSQGLMLTMHHPRSAIVSVTGSSSMEARFIDEETGQVTISTVYGQ